MRSLPATLRRPLPHSQVLYLLRSMLPASLHHARKILRVSTCCSAALATLGTPALSPRPTSGLSLQAPVLLYPARPCPLVPMCLLDAPVSPERQAQSRRPRHPRSLLRPVHPCLVRPFPSPLPLLHPTVSAVTCPLACVQQDVEEAVVQAVVLTPLYQISFPAERATAVVRPLILSPYSQCPYLPDAQSQTHGTMCQFLRRSPMHPLYPHPRVYLPPGASVYREQMAPLLRLQPTRFFKAAARMCPALPTRLRVAQVSSTDAHATPDISFCPMCLFSPQAPALFTTAPVCQ